MRTIHVSCALLLGLGLLAGCGGGGGGGEAGPAYDLNGWWELGTRNTGSPVPHEVGLILPTLQTGSSVLFNDTSLTLEGSTLRGAKPDPAAPDRTEYTFSVISSDHLEGEAVTYRGGVPDSSQTCGCSAIRRQAARLRAPAGSERSRC